MSTVIHSRPRLRLWTVIALLAAVLGGAFAVSGVSSTQAAWTDAAHASAAVTAGSWVAPVTNGCTTISTKNGRPIAGAACSIASSSFTQWSDGSSTVRDYYISLDSPVNGAGIAHEVSLDLSTIAGAGTWAWGSSVLVPSGSYTLVNGYKCLELPLVRATLPENQGSTPQLWLRVVEKSTMPLAASKTCK